MTHNYTLTTRPHWGVATGRTIYEIRDADTGQIVRTQITPPTEEDCAAAVRNVRSGKNAWGVPLPAGSTSPSKRAGAKL